MRYQRAPPRARARAGVSDSAAEVRERFIEQQGLSSQGDGLPRIAGRMLGLLIFDGRPYSFGDLATELQVSRGSVSTNARLLEALGAIERVTRPGDRQDYFQLSEDPYSRILDGALERAEKRRHGIEKSRAALPVAGNAGPRKRLQEYESFYRILVEALSEAQKRLR